MDLFCFTERRIHNSSLTFLLKYCKFYVCSWQHREFLPYLFWASKINCVKNLFCINALMVSIHATCMVGEHVYRSRCCAIDVKNKTNLLKKTTGLKSMECNRFWTLGESRITAAMNKFCLIFSKISHKINKLSENFLELWRQTSADIFR